MVRNAIFFFLSLFSFVEAENLKEKIYVKIEDLVFEANGIWFKELSGSVRVGAEALRVDSFGYYVEKQEQNWVCPKCTYLNKRPYPRYSCLNCGWPYD